MTPSRTPAAGTARVHHPVCAAASPARGGPALVWRPAFQVLTEPHLQRCSEPRRRRCATWAPSCRTRLGDGSRGLQHRGTHALQAQAPGPRFQGADPTPRPHGWRGEAFREGADPGEGTIRAVSFLFFFAAAFSFVSVFLNYFQFARNRFPGHSGSSPNTHQTLCYLVSVPLT